MRKSFVGLIAVAAMTMAAAPARASTTCATAGTFSVDLSEGVEQNEAFCEGGATTFDFTFTVPTSDTYDLDIALNDSADKFQVTTDTSPSMINIYSPGYDFAYTAGTYTVDITLVAESDPFGGFDLTPGPIAFDNENFPGLGFPNISSTPLPSTWLMLLGGLVGLGFFAYRGTKSTVAAVAS
jgi:hypothetical protein